MNEGRREGMRTEGAVFYVVLSLFRFPLIMSLQVETDGDAKGVAGKNGVADSERGVWPAIPADPASSLDDSCPSASVSGKMALNARWTR